MRTCSEVLFGATSTEGFSKTADFVVRQSAEYDRKWRRNADFFRGMTKALDELAEVANEASEPDWDGYNGSAVADETCRIAHKLLTALPLGTEMPTFAADADGLVVLEWFHGPRRAISIAVSPDRQLHYAALIGTSTQQGTELFFGAMPPRLFGIIREVTHR